TGNWEAIDLVNHSVIHEDMKKRFELNKKALKNFQAFSPSSMKIILHWILDAKRPETRKKRVELTVSRAADNSKAYP
ncbi:MAG TPA: YdeI/OmpD-associated family protein, partial [Chryseosolibacter sp.]|nr:YdeI/OmpD-associated family protein [Chryseosolibacter sp.]